MSQLILNQFSEVQTSKLTILLRILQGKDFFNKEALEEFNSGRQISVIIFSLRTAEIFLEALKKYNLGNKTSIIMAYCISKNIASMLQAKGIQSKILTEPTEDAILDLL